VNATTRVQGGGAPAGGRRGPDRISGTEDARAGVCQQAGPLAGQVPRPTGHGRVLVQVVRAGLAAGVGRARQAPRPRRRRRGGRGGPFQAAAQDRERRRGMQQPPAAGEGRAAQRRGRANGLRRGDVPPARDRRPRPWPPLDSFFYLLF
jgi:hypothetical protein